MNPGGEGPGVSTLQPLSSPMTAHTAWSTSRLTSSRPRNQGHVDRSAFLTPDVSSALQAAVYSSMPAKLLSHVQLFVTPWTVTCQAPLSMGFLGKNTGVGCYALLQGIFLDPGIQHVSLRSPALAGGFFITGATWEAPQGSTWCLR